MSSSLGAQRLTNEILANQAVLADRSTDVLVLIDRSVPHGAELVEAAVRSHGGRIMFVASDIGYIRARMPVPAIAAIERLTSVERLQVDGKADISEIPDLVDTPQERWPSTPQSVLPAKPRLDIGGLRLDSPAFGAGDVDLPNFRRSFPSFDGRGVGIAVVEGVGELDHPTLRSALSLQGKPVRKIAGIVATGQINDEVVTGAATVATAEASAPDGTPAVARSVVTDTSARFHFDGRDVIAPRPGKYLAVTVDPDSYGTLVPKGQRVLILWRAGERRAWVDADGSGDLRHVDPTRDFNDSGELGRFPAKGYETSTILGEGKPIGFALVFDDMGVPSIFAGNGPHTTGVAGIAAGSAFGGGNAGSAAPQAQIVFVTGPNSSSATMSQILEGIIITSRRPDVDLLTISTDADDIEGLDSIAGEVVGRITEVTGKICFAAAGNTLGVTETINGFEASPNVLAVGGYMNRDMAKFLGGINLPAKDYVIAYSRGPSRLGDMKPDLLAPSPTLAPTFSRNKDSYHSAAAWNLGRGYYLANGTSIASPGAASVAAALISGAKQRGIPFDATRLSWAMKAGARYLSAWPAHAQGAGLINISASWKLLELAATLPEWRFAPKITVMAPIRTAYAEAGARLPRGRGLYEREGWSVGQSGVRYITLTRNKGPAGAVRYPLRWTGNDGSFAIPNYVDLPLGRPVRIKVSIKMTTPGVHSANLTLLDPKYRLRVQWVSVVAVAAAQLSAANEFTTTESSTREMMRVSSHFVNVPRGAQALRVDFRSRGGRSMIIEEPSIILHTMSLQKSSYAEYWAMSDLEKRGASTRLYPKPAEGVWEFTARDFAGSDGALETGEVYATNKHSIVFTALGARIDRLKTETSAKGVTRLSFNWYNAMGQLETPRTVIRIGAERRYRVYQAKGVPPVFSQFFIGPRVDSLYISAQADDGTPLRVYLYDGGGLRAESAYQESSFKLWEVPFDASLSFTIRKPDPGPWRTIVRAADGTEWHGSYTLKIITTNELYGATRAKEVVGPRKHGERWNVWADVQIAHRVFPLGSRPVAVVELEDPGSERAESSSISSPTGFQRPVAVGSAFIPLQGSK